MLCEQIYKFYCYFKEDIFLFLGFLVSIIMQNIKKNKHVGLRSEKCFPSCPGDNICFLEMLHGNTFIPFYTKSH